MGLSFLFVTDIPEELLKAGLQSHNLEGRFLALPGEEMFTSEVHANALNVKSSLQRLTKPDDTRESLRRWLAEIRRLRSSGEPTALMLNHPSHLPEPMSRHAYFRSWWVADEFPEISLVENFDFPSWFERLNRGRRLTGLWTTDLHDTSFIPPGHKRVYVFVGERLDERAVLLHEMAGGIAPADGGRRDARWDGGARCRRASSRFRQVLLVEAP